MRNWTKRLLTLVVLCLSLGLFFGGGHAEAAGKAVKVKSSIQYTKNSKVKMTVKGVDKKGKIVWTYKTKSKMATELSPVMCKTKGSRVYIFEGAKVRVVKKSTGKKLWVSKKISPAGHVIAIDSKYNLYVTGYYDTVIYKVSSKGKTVWKSDISKTQNYWPTKIKLTKNKVKITYDANMLDANGPSTSSHFVTLSAKTGKILSYK